MEMERSKFEMLGERYLKEVINIINKVIETQLDKIKTAAEMIVNASINKHNIYIFGCNHAGILAEELFYRTGGLAIINPIRAPGLMLDTKPITLTTEIERLSQYGRIIVDSLNIGKGDILIIHSVSGRNNVPIDMALRARELGSKVIAVTNVNYSSKVNSRHDSGKRLFEVADVILDNCGVYGDAILEVEGLQCKIGPTSTVVGAALLNAVVVECVEIFLQKGVKPPIFMSSNVEGGDQYNALVLEEYKDNIHYM